jgi:hypothetical protein
MRRPARLERAGALTPRDRMWAAMRELRPVRPDFSVAEIMVLSTASRAGKADTTPLEQQTVMPYIEGLCKAEPPFVVPVPTARSLPACMRRFQLVRDVGVEAPRVDRDGSPTTEGIGQQQMWRAIRITLRDEEFDKHKLCAAASIEAHVVPASEARYYLRHLQAAGYVRLTQPCKKASKGKIAQAAKYQFVRSRDTGPRAPLITRDKTVIDGNTGQEFK